MSPRRNGQRQRTNRKSQARNARLIKRAVPVRAPVSYGFTDRSRVSLYTRRGNTFTRIREIFPVTGSNDGTLCFMLPFCPTKWAGTRACAICRTFTDFRPIRVRVSWQPIVGTNTTGSITVGTVFSGARLPTSTTYASISQCLSITNGGFMTTVWKPHVSNISVGRNLRANNFPMYEVDPDDVPFWIVASSSITSGSIGNIVIDAQISLKNPVTGESSVPVAGTGTATLTHTDESDTQPAQTILSIPQSALNFTPTAGSDFSLCCNQPLLNTTGGVMVPTMSPLLATYTGMSGSNCQFQVDSFLASATALASFIGRVANFIYRIPATGSSSA